VGYHFPFEQKGCIFFGTALSYLLKVNMINDMFQLAQRRMDAVLYLLILSSATH